MADLETPEVETPEHVETPPARDYEAEARSQGWRPENEWTGKPGKWKDAETFVRDGEQIAKVQTTRLREMEQQFRQQLDDQARINQEAAAFLKAGYERQIAELKAQRRDAVKVGDVDKVDELDAALESLPKPPEPAPRPAAPQAAPQELLDWADQRPWIKDADSEDSQIAGAISRDLKARYPDRSWSEHLAALDERLKKVLPHRYTRPQPTLDTVTRGGGAGMGAGGVEVGGKRRTYSQLPPDAKAACDRFVGQKLMTVEEYLANYSWE